MRYDFDKLARHSEGLGFQTARPSDEVLEITVLEGVVLFAQNLIEENDSAMGFDGTPWHFHGELMLMLDASRYVEFDEYELISALKNGDAVIVERFLNSALQDRWVAHKLEPFELQHIEPGEELRIRRIS